MKTPPEATPERLAWVASLKEGEEVWHACAIDERRNIETIISRRREDERPGLQVGAYLLRADGTLSRQGYAAWVEPVTDEDRVALRYKALLWATECRGRSLSARARYGTHEDQSLADCVAELLRINRLLDEAGLLWPCLSGSLFLFLPPYSFGGY